MQHFDFESTISSLHQHWLQLYSQQTSTTGDSQFSPDCFRQAVMGILDESALTKAWSHDDLITAFEAPDDILEQRTEIGPVAFIQPWRDAFWRYEMSCILLTWKNRDFPPPDQSFWLTLLNEELEGKHLLATPPMSPSLLKPDRAGLAAYALQDDYVNFANTHIRQYLAEQANTRCVADSFWQRASALFNRNPYIPDNPESVIVLGRILSAISVLRTSAKLGFLESTASEQHQTLLAYLAGEGKLNFRLRNDPLWPKEKRPRIYVDLRIHDVLAQVLEYRKSEWHSGISLRSLPLKDGNSGTEDGNLITTKLRRIDIEMAVWCEIMLRILNSPESGPLSMMKNAKDIPGEADGLNRLLPHQRNWVKSIVDAINRLPQKPGRPTQRFVAPPGTLPELYQDNQVTLLPPNLSRPTLDGNQLRCLLDWNLIAPLGDWMDIQLLLVSDQGEISVIEHEAPPEASDIDDLWETGLKGEIWQQLNQRYSSFELRCLFENIWFGYRTDPSGTGAIMIGVVNARPPTR